MRAASSAVGESGRQMNYQEALDFLTGLTKFGINFGLERIEHLMSLLGNPERALKVIHVGGTNGKGSTAVMVSRVLEAAGFRVGLFSSPHLHSYTERYLINHRPISQERFAGLMERLKPLLERMVAEGREHPTEFEVCTALALLYFFEEKVDYVVLEVGLGGVIDSTNVVPNPLVSVITNVAFDHMDYLGNTITAIAEKKAGIIKEKGYVVTAAWYPEALAVIEERCREMGATLLRVGKEITWELRESTPEATLFDLRSPWGFYQNLKVPLAGQYQAVNAATALGVVELLRYRHGVRIGDDHLRQGLARSRWPARLEMISRAPQVIVDVTHNHDGSRMLKNALRNIYRYRRLILVMGMLGDKEREKVVAELAPLASVVIITKPLNPRAGDWEKLADEAKRYVEQVFVIEKIAEAVDAALKEASTEDLVCVTGSFYMVADARAYLLERYFSEQQLALEKCGGRRE
ncbi:MAG: Folylpolyglutamate synthase FolC [Thermacetogenium phaeum]|jgi:dihydrofolate synthase/folylpolyglutamate synthase|uniref:Dihydrofolate synthase/folylpolyglutamate synthase n=1 Tax=Thermacetogenium phaeum TaxID=85874 RepID=A0A117LAW8_9THEO|nr:MAG: Folylpolyglutamate synthase FolC [Thermacetogenium phaeum]